MLTYQGTKFFKVYKNIMAQGGDVLSNDGRGSLGIYGPNFKVTVTTRI
jgi:cyclophilin family peptidyl-prolyl cis-trans isomerase